jgi:integrase
MIETGICRKQINKRVARIKRMWQWGAAKKLVPLMTHQSLQTVEGLRAGRTNAKESPPVRPVAVSFVEEVIPFMTPQVAAMVRLQLATAARPGEISAMRTGDIDMGGKIWMYTPRTHKTAYRGHSRAIAIGAKGQEILRPWLRPNLEEYLFQPREARAAFDAKRKAERKSKLPPSQAARQRKTNPKKKPSDHYSKVAYSHAVWMACERAHAEAEKAVPENKRTLAPHFTPHQLRHTQATRIRKEYGLDHARAVLGHKSMSVTGTYAELDAGKALEVAAKLG